MIIRKFAPNLLLVFLSFTLVSCWNEGTVKTQVLSTNGINSAAFNNSDSLAVICSIYDGASLWHNQNNQQLFKWRHTSNQDQSIHLVALSDNGKLAATVSNNINLYIWNAVDGNHITSFQSPSKINQLAIIERNNAVILRLKIIPDS